MRNENEQYDYEFDWVLRSQAIKAIQRRKQNQENITTLTSATQDKQTVSEFYKLDKDNFNSNKSSKALKPENSVSKLANNTKI